MAATESSFPSCEKAPESSCAQWQEELRGSGPGLTPMWTDTDTRPLDSERPPAGAAQSKHTHTRTHPQQRHFLSSRAVCLNILQMFHLVLSFKQTTSSEQEIGLRKHTQALSRKVGVTVTYVKVFLNQASWGRTVLCPYWSFLLSHSGRRHLSSVRSSPGSGIQPD